MPFDWTPIRNAFCDGDFALCRDLLNAAPEPHASFWHSRIDSRLGTTASSMARLLGLRCPDSRSSAERDACLALAYANSGDFSMARTLFDRALEVLKPPDEAYYRSIYSRGLANYFAGDLDATRAAMDELLTSPNACDRGAAYAMCSWVAARRGDVQGQLRGVLDALDEYLSVERTDQNMLGHAVQALGLFCRERPADDTIVRRLRMAAQRVRICDGTAFTRFQIARVLGWIDALRGDEVAAMRHWRDAEPFAPSPFWRVFCSVDRAFLAQVMGRAAAAAQLLQEADRLAQDLPWAQTREEERLVLLTIAQLLSRSDAPRAERYLAMYRSLNTRMHLRLSWEGDRRLQALQRYPHGVALVHLGEPDAGVPMLEDAWKLFTELDYRWRAALAALDLYKATSKTEWLQHAREQAAPWPKSWIARDVRELG